MSSTDRYDGATRHRLLGFSLRTKACGKRQVQSVVPGNLGAGISAFDELMRHEEKATGRIKCYLLELCLMKSWIKAHSWKIHPPIAITESGTMLNVSLDDTS